MHQKLTKTNKKHLFEYAGLTALFIVAIYTRFFNLGYSDYIGDEHKAFYQPVQGESAYHFFMNQRKGPMQFAVSHIPYLITGDFTNELAQRIPFALINVAAIFVFYLFVKKVTKSKLIAFLSAFLLAVNGFIVGFGRIAQYQNLNLLFSFLALYFYADVFLLNDQKIIRNSLLGTLFWVLSILSHWDAIFILPVVVAFFSRLLLSKEITREIKKKALLYNFLLGAVLLLPYLIPYTQYQLANEDNKTYFLRRVRLGYINTQRYNTLINLYNPFLNHFILVVFGLSGIFLVRRSYVFALWFLFSYGIFEAFVRKPGTHIYNFVLPLIILTAITFTAIFNHLKGWLKYLWLGLGFCALGFLSWQTHVIFIDHTSEYPWEQKRVLDLTRLQDYYYDQKNIEDDERSYLTLTTPKYSIEQKLPLFGFPHKRYWKEINYYINEQNAQNSHELGYMTNEVKTISEWYMDAKYLEPENAYIVGIKRPLSFVKDYNFPQIGSKDTVYEINNEFGETVVRIYLLRENIQQN